MQTHYEQRETKGGREGERKVEGEGEKGERKGKRKREDEEKREGEDIEVIMFK